MADSKSEEENIQNGPVTSCCTRIQTTQRTMSCFFTRTRLLKVSQWLKIEQIVYQEYESIN